MNNVNKSYSKRPVSEKPWMNIESFHKTFYPPSYGKSNCYALFSPAVDRFIIIDNYDLWAMVETGKLLSSKFSSIIYIFDRPTPEELNNSNCLEYSTLHKVFETGYGSPLSSSHKQTSTLRKILPDMVVHKGMSPDYAKPDRLEMLYRLREYCLFTLRAVYSITLSNEIMNYFPESHYRENYFKHDLPFDFRVLHDSTKSPNGMMHEIKNILYHSNTVEEALEKIDIAWRT